MNKSKTIVEGMTEVEETYKKRRGWFLFFQITWWEKVKTESFGNDIMIITENEIRDVYLNGKKIFNN